MAISTGHRCMADASAVTAFHFEPRGDNLSGDTRAATGAGRGGGRKSDGRLKNRGNSTSSNHKGGGGEGRAQPSRRGDGGTNGGESSGMRDSHVSSSSHRSHGNHHNHHQQQSYSPTAVPLTKSQFMQAHFKLIVNESIVSRNGGAGNSFWVPDTQISWDSVESVIVRDGGGGGASPMNSSSSSSSNGDDSAIVSMIVDRSSCCPICLDTPRLEKITTCGHSFW